VSAMPAMLPETKEPRGGTVDWWSTGYRTRRGASHRENSVEYHVKMVRETSSIAALFSLSAGKKRGKGKRLPTRKKRNKFLFLEECREDNKLLGGE